MNEAFLHYVWKHKLLANLSLKTRSGEPIRVLQPGLLNINAGPDFLNARVRIANKEWVGNVEIHVLSSDFILHAHGNDENYANLILHVVYEYDKDVSTLEQTKTPTLELMPYMPDSLIKKYWSLSQNKSVFIPCENLFSRLEDFKQLAWTERLIYERWESKTKQELPKTIQNIDWERLLFIKLAKALGQSINADAMEAWADSIPWEAVKKTRTKPEQLFALFLGTAGLLSDSYASPKIQTWKKEFLHLTAKFKLNESPPIAFRFFRLRPHSFPTIRIAQLANLIAHYPNGFSRWVEEVNWNVFEEDVTQLHLDEFWNTHFTLKEESTSFGVKKVSTAKCRELYINAILPLSYTHRRFLGNREWGDLVEIQNNLQPEQNTITKGFGKLGWKAKNASESQAQIHLKKTYCDKKKCLHCRFGHSILQP